MSKTRSTDVQLGDLIVDLVNACSSPIAEAELQRLVRWADDTITNSTLLRLLRKGKIEILVGKDGSLPASVDDWNYRKRDE
jgi:hypothetical protein